MKALYDGLDLEFVGIEEAGFISCTGPDDYWNGRAGALSMQLLDRVLWSVSWTWYAPIPTSSFRPETS